MWNWLGIANEPKSGENTVEKISKEKAENNKENVENSAKESAENSDKTDKTQEDTPLNTEKVKEVASNIGNYLYNFASVASQKAALIKDTVDVKLENTIVGEFNRENEKFIQEKEARRIGDAVPPWVGFHEEEIMKSQILALSSDERNFLRDPPAGVDFQFNLELMMPVALSMLKEDSSLEEMRFKLVPKRVVEEKFWRNYFYRVSLVKQSTQLSTLNNKDKSSPRDSVSDVANKGTEKPDSLTETQEDQSLDDALANSPANNEFASDAFDTNAHLSEEEKTQMSLGLNDAKNQANETDNNDWDLEKELQDEIESFELLDGNDDDNNDWQQEIDQLLEEEENAKKSP